MWTTIPSSWSTPALLTSSPQGKCNYIDADLRDLGKILDRAAATLDFSRPVAIVLLGMLLTCPTPTTRTASWPARSAPCHRQPRGDLASCQ
jgi:hypothetical protein